MSRVLCLAVGALLIVACRPTTYGGLQAECGEAVSFPSGGRASQYAEHPIVVAPGELVRLYVVNAGPNRISSFHVVGGIFERVYEDGTQANPLIGVQTVNIPVDGGSIFEVRLREAGDYPFVTHAFADATKGVVGVLRAVAPAD